MPQNAVAIAQCCAPYAALAYRRQVPGRGAPMGLVTLLGARIRANLVAYSILREARTTASGRSQPPCPAAEGLGGCSRGLSRPRSGWDLAWPYGVRSVRAPQRPRRFFFLRGETGPALLWKSGSPLLPQNE